MSAKLMKSLADGVCVVQNRRSGQIRVYWDQDRSRKYVDLDGHATLDLTAHAPLAALRKSASLKNLVHQGHIAVL